DHVVERQTVDGHSQLGAVGEVAGTQATGVMDLGEEDFLGVALQSPPLLAAALQGPQRAAAEAARETALQVDKDGLGLQLGVEPKQIDDAGPDLGKGIGSGTPVPVHGFDLAGELAQAAILASALGVYASLQGSPFLANALLVEATELPHLGIGDHREPPCQEARR